MMRRRLVLLGILCILLLGAGFWWFLSNLAAPFRLALRGSVSTSDRLRVSGGNLAITAGTPGVFFGTVRKPDGPEEFTYVILFRYAPPAIGGHSHGLEFSASSEGGKSRVQNALTLNGRRVEAEYQIELGKDSAVREELRVGGQPVDPAAGTVFLIDLNDAGGVYQQKRVVLPPIPAGGLKTPAEVEELAQTIRARLAEADAEIRAFLR